MPVLLVPLLAVLHLGALHPAEKALTLVLALGPFLVLAVVVAVRRRQDARRETDGSADSSPQSPD